MEAYSEVFEVELLAEGIADDLRALAQARGNRLRVAIDPAVGASTADRLKLENALHQIVHNAIKHTENGTATTTAGPVSSARGEAIRIAVEDTGIGIAAEHLSSLFEQFAIGDEQTATKYGGTGLGLALARKLCRLMGGDIAVETEPGRGSRFTLTVPVAPAAQDPARPRPACEPPTGLIDIPYPKALAA